MTVTLVKPTLELEEEYMSFYQEWIDSNENIVPWVVSKDPKDFQGMIDFLMDNEAGHTIPEGWVIKTYNIKKCWSSRS